MSEEKEVIDTGEVEDQPQEITFEEALEQVTGEKAAAPVESDKEDDDQGEQVADQDTEKVEEDIDDKVVEGEKEPSEVDNLRRDVMRLSGHNSKLQQELNQKAKVVRKVKAPVIDENGVFTKSFEEIQKEFPEADFGRVEKIVVGQNDQINKLSDQISALNDALQKTRVETHQVQMKKEVLSKHADFDEAVRSPEFESWRKALPPETQQMITSTNDPSEIGVILDNFKSVTGFKGKAIKEAESRESTQQAADKRSRRNAASVSVSTKQPSSPITGLADGFNVDAEMKKVWKNLGVKY